METIDKEQLRERLIEEGYVPEFGLDRTVENLLNLKNLNNIAAYNMLVEWMKTGSIQKFEPIEGIDLRFLRDNLKMKKPAIILAYGMLLYDPVGNAEFLRNQEKSRNEYRPKTVK